MNDTARELYLYTCNCFPAWQAVEAAARNYERKRAKGVYDSALAAKGLAYAVELAAKAYIIEHCSGERWHDIFPAGERRDVAAAIVVDLEAEWAAGNSWTLAA